MKTKVVGKMLVRQLNIEGFRGIRKCKEPLELSKFTVLIGRNNSGKSAVLESLYLPLLSLRSSDSAYDIDRLGLLSRLHGGPSSLVYAYSGVAEVDYTINERKVAVEVDAGGNAKLLMDGAEMMRPLDSLADILGTEPNFTAVGRTIFFIPNETSLLKGLVDRIENVENWNLIVKTGAHVSVVEELVNKCVDDRYTEVLLSPGLCLRKELALNYASGRNFLYIKLPDLGDGLKKAVAVSLWLETYKPKMVLWDDFEASAHPSLIRQLLEWLSKKDWQVILSTHSIDVLSKLLEVRPKDAKVLQLRKTRDDILIHGSFSMEELESVMEEAQHDPRLLVDALKL